MTMRNDIKADGFESIRCLINEESEAALGIFNENEAGFNARLNQRIDALHRQPKLKRRCGFPVLFTRRSIPVFATAVILVITTVLWVILSPGSRSDAQKLERFFLAVAAAQGETGGEYDINEPDQPVQTGEERHRWELEWFLKGAFQQARSKNYTREGLKQIFENLLCFDCRPRESSTLSPIPPGKTDLEDRIRNLKKEKVIDHFLDKRKNENRMEV